MQEFFRLTTTIKEKKWTNFHQMASNLAWSVLSEYCANILEYLRKIINSEDFFNRHRLSSNSFVRKRFLTFRIMILLLINMLKGSIQDELDHFFKAMSHSEIFNRVVTKSAFSQARKNLDPLAFVELNSQLIRKFYTTAPIRTWNGFSLLAVDGSTIKVPKNKENSKHFGTWKTAAGTECPMARISQLFDVLNKLTVAAIASPKSLGEREHASELFLNLRPMDLVLLDRGYPAFWLFKLILTIEGHFCARISEETWNVVQRFKKSGEIDATLKFKASWPARKTCQELGLDTKSMKLRLVRVVLDTGESEILITSLLDQQAYPTECFGDLYHYRWPVEEDYKHMKHRLELENFSGKSVLSVFQDFHAKVFSKNLAAVLTHSLQEKVDQDTSERKYRYQINFTQFLSKLKDTVILLFDREIIIPLIRKLMDIACCSIEPIRPNRKCQRKKKVAPPRFRPSYKPIR